MTIFQAMTYLSANRIWPSVICTDSLSSLQLLSQPLPTSYTHLIASIHNLLTRIPAGAVKFQWIPSHTGVPGNEAADKVARRAASSESIPVELPLDVTELKSMVRQEVWRFWQSKWTSARGQFALGMTKLSVRPWSLRTLQSRRFETLFARLRLGTAPLNKALYQIRQAPSPLCTSCQVAETTHHYLIACKEYNEARSQLRRQLQLHGVQVLSLYTLLGGDTASSLAWPQTCRAVEQFISATHRFGQ
ncbi:uncharacterized protein LOC108677310 [Hyalella azteca]|uniref:Uncharacterized protein LOC108677310 n=1 Tax=Hyalella azteca TaxID=294128 RepID=A0A8B7P4Y7_HYAAZ|nr:uncharacterized protein LOC108677310 [Hyalella azteca]